MTIRTSDISHLERLKADLMKMPLTAYSHAIAGAARCHLRGDDVLAEIYQAIAEQLGREGYAPDPETGTPGPATKAYYQRSVMGGP